MTNASFCLLWAFPPRGSAVRLKSRLRRYSASGASAAARDSAGLALAPRLAVLLRAVAFFGMCASRVVELSNLIAGEPTAAGAGHAAPRRRPAHRPTPARHRPLSAASH